MKEHGTHNFELAEKMVYAFTLLEKLQISGLEFIFKGGTSLVLMIDQFHRFSKDIDIILPEKPGNLKEIFDAVIAGGPFIRWEPSPRKND